MAKRFIIGIDLGGTNLKIALLDLKYRIKDKRILSTASFIRKGILINAIIDSVNKIIKGNALEKKDILGVGLGLPGPVDAKAGIVHFLPNIPGWKEVRLKTILRQKLRLPVFVDNDAKVMSLAEYKLGRGRGFKNVVCLTLGTGIGGGIIISGKLYRGFNNASSEIGHIPINEKGPRCNCGAVACLEAYIGNKRILAQARKVFKRNTITLEEVSRLANKGNPEALAVWAAVAKHLGSALVGIVNLLNPDCIILGGGVANAGEVLFSRVRKIISCQAMSVQARHVKLYKAKLSSDAGLIGAGILVKEERP